MLVPLLLQRNSSTFLWQTVCLAQQSTHCCGSVRHKTCKQNVGLCNTAGQTAAFRAFVCGSLFTCLAKPEWEEEFTFTDKGGKPLCLICQDSLGHYKASNMKRYHEIRHNIFSNNYPPRSALSRSSKKKIITPYLDGKCVNLYKLMIV